MAKKVLLVIVLAVIAAGGAFAIDMSAGGGAFYASDFGGGVQLTEIPWDAIGIYGFFDAAYAEVSASLGFGSGTVEFLGNNVGLFSFTSLNFGLLGKYPFYINDKITLFPAVGIEYQAVLSAKLEGDEKKPGDFSVLWFRFGGGLDYNFTDKLYLRGTFLYGIRTASKFEKDGLTSEYRSTKLGHGPALKVAVGYKF
jgi:opacity protein-like surface antigen